LTFWFAYGGGVPWQLQHTNYIIFKNGENFKKLLFFFVIVVGKNTISMKENRSIFWNIFKIL
jgi:hypothetical protein